MTQSNKNNKIEFDNKDPSFFTPRRSKLIDHPERYRNTWKVKQLVKSNENNNNIQASPRLVVTTGRKNNTSYDRTTMLYSPTKKITEFTVNSSKIQNTPTIPSLRLSNQTFAANNDTEEYKLLELLEFGTRNIKWGCEWIRWLIIYLNLPFTEWNPHNKQEWFEKKKYMEDNFGVEGLPYIRDTYQNKEILVTGYSDISDYICQKGQRFDLLGNSELEMRKVIELEGNLENFSNLIYEIARHSKITVNKEWNSGLKNDIEDFLEEFEILVEGENTFLIHLTKSDFFFYYCYMFLKDICNEIRVENPIKSYFKLYTIIQGFEKINKIQIHINSEQYRKKKWMEPELDIFK